MSGLAKSLFSEVQYDGKKMKLTEVLGALHALPPGAMLTTSEAAIFLRSSVTKMERFRKDGGGPTYSQAGGSGTNQACLYKKENLEAWLKGNEVSDSLEAAVRKGQTFATIFDLAEHEAFYVDEAGNVESMVVENLLRTVVERIGLWDIAWMTPVEAASRRWSDLSKHKEFAEGVQSTLNHALRSVQSGIDATDIASVTEEAPSRGAKPIDG